jgi:hypothetical protein
MKLKTQIVAMFVLAIGAVALVVPVAQAGSEPLKRGLGDFGVVPQAGPQLKPGLSDFGLSFNLIAVPATSGLDTVSMLDARERAFAAKQPESATSMLDARERAFGAKREAQLTSGQYPDVVERAVAAKGPIRTPVGDDRFRIDHSNVPVPVSATSSGRELEWPQIGIGFGVGIVLMLGLYLALKAMRTRPLAH